MKWTGLTGGIATGKTTASKLIQGLGFPVVDADFISHQVTKQGEEGYSRIVSHFGNRVVSENGMLDRRTLGDIVFNDQKELAALEGILHPIIQKEVKKQREILVDEGHQRAFYDVPLLFEKNMMSQFDDIVVVWCSNDIQIKRLCERNKLSFVQAQSRLKNQMSLVEKIKMAHHCIDNSGDIEDLQIQITRLLEKLNSTSEVVFK